MASFLREYERVELQAEYHVATEVLWDRLEQKLSRLRIINTNQSTAAVNKARQGVGIALVHPVTLSGASASNRGPG